MKVCNIVYLNTLGATHGDFLVVLKFAIFYTIFPFKYRLMYNTVTIIYKTIFLNIFIAFF